MKRILPWVVIVAVLMLAVKLATPSFIRNHRNDPRGVCINNLRLIDSAKMQFELETKAEPGDAVTMEMIARYLKRNPDSKISPCPSGGSYLVNPAGAYPTCTLAEQGHKLSDDVTSETLTNAEAHAR